MSALVSGDPREYIVFKNGAYWCTDRHPNSGAPWMLGKTESEAIATILTWRGCSPKEILKAIGDDAFRDWCILVNERRARLYDYFYLPPPSYVSKLMYPWSEDPKWDEE